MAPHGIPIDLLDRVMIIRTLPYTLEEIAIILSIRAKTESLLVDEEAIQYLAEVGAKSSLRFAIQLMTPSKIMAHINGKDNISLDDVKEVDSMFFDAKASAKMLNETEEKYIV